MPRNVVNIRRLSGLQPYQPVWRAMQAYTEGRDESSADEIWLLQHEPVFTMGRNAKREHLLETGDIPVVDIDRGGQVTYHGPGQLMAYLLLDIRRLKMGVRQIVSAMEHAVINVLSSYGIQAEARADAPGVYVDGAKIAALGLRVKQGRCYHGLSFNIDMDMTPFSRINPCGYAGLAVTQLKDHVESYDWQEMENRLLKQLQQQLGDRPFVEITEPVRR
ncbi:MAG: lipoyl(octanoyl) transferase LipB [Gammaproteobacteria bacterium]|nr:lipoyl(octanoyl) transferase LipB [Gammaproteobacteria bacterium]